MNINHRPRLDKDKVCELYSEKDGVPIKYICTTALGNGSSAVDVFYRETPHPEFGNKYFGLYWNFDNNLMITNADKIEELEFDMLDIDGEMHYSQHRHDYYTVKDVSIDGGRAYLKMAGNLTYPVKTLIVRNGEFVEKETQNV